MKSRSDLSLWTLLRCPRCKAPLEQSAQQCIRTQCPGRWDMLPGAIPYFAADWVEQQPPLVAEIESQRLAAASYLDRHSFSFHWNRRRMREALAFLNDDAEILVDLGCGAGLIAECWDPQRIVGIDVSPDLLQEARRRLPHLVGAVAEELPLADESVDAVFARGVLHHVLEPQRAVAEIARVLRPGGIAILSDPRAFALLEWCKAWLRKDDPKFAPTHRAFGRDAYLELLGGRRLQVVQRQDVDPLVLPWLVLADRCKANEHVPVERITAGCLDLDRLAARVNRLLPGLRTHGFILQIVARKESRHP
jgi:ubiquinone/menaquinone biosynthesis C-methylase UbiE